VPNLLLQILVPFYPFLGIISDRDNQSPRGKLALFVLNALTNIYKLIEVAGDKTWRDTKESFNRNQHGEEEDETRENLAKAPYVFRTASD
jgi:hypothetical protein